MPKSTTPKAQVNIFTCEPNTNQGFVTINPELFNIYESNEWLIDSSATIHVCIDRSLFCSYQVVDGKALVLKTINAIFIGYAHRGNAYRFLVIKFEMLGIDVTTIVEFRDTTFLKMFSQ